MKENVYYAMWGKLETIRIINGHPCQLKAVRINGVNYLTMEKLKEIGDGRAEKNGKIEETKETD